MQDAIKTLEAAYQDRLAEAEKIRAAIDILKGLAPVDAPTTPGAPHPPASTPPPPASSGRLPLAPGIPPTPTPAGKPGFTTKKCMACGHTDYMHARTRNCPECGAIGKIVKASNEET